MDQECRNLLKKVRIRMIENHMSMDQSLILMKRYHVFLVTNASSDRPRRASIILLQLSIILKSFKAKHQLQQLDITISL